MEPLLAPDSARQARAIAREIALRLAEPERYDALVGALPPMARSVVDLAFGYPGPALLFAALAQREPDGAWAALAHDYLVRAFSSGVESSSGLFIGYGGLLFGMNVRGGADPRYLAFAARLAERVARPEGMHGERGPIRTATDYDIIGGLAGTLVAVAPHSRAFTDETLAALAERTRAGGTEPWRVTSPLDGTSEEYVDYGAAHGIPGVLGAICIVTAPGEQHELKRRLVDLIVAAKRPAPGGAGDRWPSKVGSLRRGPPKPGWCYGTPGVASILWVAGHQLGDAALRRLALSAFESVAAAAVEDLALLDNGLCHGNAGLAALAAAVGRASGSPALLDLSRRLGEAVVRAFDPRTPVGYREFFDGGLVDNPAFLGGASGIALALLFLAGDVDATWLQALGLAAVPPAAARARATGTS